MTDNQDNKATLTAEEKKPGVASTFDVGPGQLNFGTFAQSMTSTKMQVLLTNNSSHEVTWNVRIKEGAGASAWLKLGQTFGDHTSGTIRANAQQLLDVTAEVSKLKDGQHHATLHFTSHDGDTDVQVSLNVFSDKIVGIVENRGDPKILEKALSLSAKTKSHVVHLTNVNPTALKWQATPGAPWLHVNPSSGSINAGQTINITVSVDTKGLPSGTYNSTVHYSWNPPFGTSAQTTVTLVV